MRRASPVSGAGPLFPAATDASVRPAIGHAAIAIPATEHRPYQSLQVKETVLVDHDMCSLMQDLGDGSEIYLTDRALVVYQVGLL